MISSIVAKYGVKLGFMSLFCQKHVQNSAGNAGKSMHLLTATISFRHPYTDIAVAISTPNGLVLSKFLLQCPGLHEIELQRSKTLRRRRGMALWACRTLTGGTFTITNGGVFGSLMVRRSSTNRNLQFGMYAIKDRPVAIDGKIEICPMMYLCLVLIRSPDHRRFCYIFSWTGSKHCWKGRFTFGILKGNSYDGAGVFNYVTIIHSWRCTFILIVPVFALIISDQWTTGIPGTMEVSVFSNLSILPAFLAFCSNAQYLFWTGNAILDGFWNTGYNGCRSCQWLPPRS